jgi:hypothetical protein
MSAGYNRCGAYFVAAEPACAPRQHIAHGGQPRVLSESESQSAIVAVSACRLADRLSLTHPSSLGHRIISFETRR